MAHFVKALRSKHIFVFLMTLLCYQLGWAQLGSVNLNQPDPPSFVKSIGGGCPTTVNCTYGRNFFSLDDADQCGCCQCNGGPVGCSGGASGYIVCADGSYAKGCRCQYRVQKEG